MLKPGSWLPSLAMPIASLRPEIRLTPARLCAGSAGPYEAADFILPVWLACRMIPVEAMRECRAAALLSTRWNRPRSYVAAAVIAAIWLGAIMLALYWFLGIVMERSER